MFTTLIVQPIFNLLVLIYALLPGHNFGLSLIIFTVVIRLLLWPLIRRQLHQAKAMRALQPEIKKIKQATKGNRAKESTMLMELYKEREINPFATFPTLIVQLIILLGLYSGLRRVISNPHTLVSFAYPSLQHLSWMRQLSHNIHLFDNTLFGVVDLSRSALQHGGGVYLPAMLIVIGSAVAQFFQGRQLLPDVKERRGLRTILKEAGNGKQADQSEVNAAVGRSTLFLLPVMIFIFTVNLASALSLYWLVGGIVAYVQQAIVLRGDETAMEAIADKPGSGKDAAAIPEAEVVTPAAGTKKVGGGKANKSKKARAKVKKQGKK
jgi:YidC/Oxa1 family membrane protein insertase